MVYGFAVFNRVNLLAYVDLNPIRAGIVRRPEEYRWCSLGYHLQSGNAGDLLSLAFGLADWNELDQQEAVRKYREFIYETGAVDAGPVECREAALPEAGFNRAGKGAVIEQGIVERERRRKYRMGRAERFLQRSRYFTDSGIIGSKEFVGEVFEKVKHLLGSQGRRRFKPVSGLNGVYSMKRLTAD